MFAKKNSMSTLANIVLFSLHNAIKDNQVANFEYIEEAEAVVEEEAQKAALENKPTTVSSSERPNYWEDLLRDRYEVHKVEEFNALGKGKRSRKQM
ncbi:hypothetical protein TorRG33x02_244760 [Trema orientale]|uniref:DUF1087 domain-containing protein n=1 Tax=Trema orientale TaxID=63057 RepID=A0A2P5DRF7_TREOI|nr:hypothetical protein TorRG33x02_244760 [Trema orientale]